MNQTFCIAAWSNLMTVPEGGTKICCSSARIVSNAAGPMRLDEHSAEAIWNSDHMAEVRRAMVAGEQVADCLSCYIAEAASGRSLRTELNRLWAPETLAGVVADSAARDHRVAYLPTALHLTVGNLCNLTCRMCNSSYSSQIEQHPELAPLAPPIFGIAPPGRPARLIRRAIGPRPTLGVAMTGFAAGCLAAGRATLDVPIAWFEKPVLLHIELGAAPAGATLAIMVNDRRLLEQPVDQLGRVLDLDVSWLPDSTDLTIALEARSGLAPTIETIALDLLVAPDAVRQTGKLTQQPSGNHLPAIEQLVANPELSQITFTGGEPMLMPEVAEVIDHLVADGRAAQVTLCLSTNATRINRRLVDQLKTFRHAQIYLSIDGIGPAFEYIRVPARWERVRENVLELVALRGPETFTVHPTVQAYNILSIVDVFRFADGLGLKFELLDILVGPPQLAHQVMPPAVRQRALERVRAYRGSECRPVNAVAVDNLIANLETTMGDFHRQLLPDFMRFTNRLDRIHGQRFRDSLPELLGLIEASGFAWTDEALDGAAA